MGGQGRFQRCLCGWKSDIFDGKFPAVLMATKTLYFWRKVGTFPAVVMAKEHRYFIFRVFSAITWCFPYPNQCFFFLPKHDRSHKIWDEANSAFQLRITYGRCHEGLKPGSASVSLIRPWLLPGLTAREWEEKGWLHTAQSARKPPNGRANAGQVIWRLGCIKAIYKGLKDLRCFTHSVCAFIRPGTGLLSFLSINTKGVIKNVAFTGVWLFCLVAEERRFFMGGSWRLVWRQTHEIIWDPLHCVRHTHTHTTLTHTSRCRHIQNQS